MVDGRHSWRRVVRELGLALVALGTVVLLFVAYELVGTNITEQHSQARLAKEFSRSLHATVPVPGSVPGPVSTTAAPSGRLHATAAPAQHPGREAARHHSAPKTGREGTGKASAQVALAMAVPSVPPGGALDHLQVPALGINRYVVEGVTEADLQMGPGHYPGTPLPGQPGNAAIAGHRTTFGAPFFELNQLVKGDLIYLTDTEGNTWAYSVQREWVVPPTDTAVLGPTPGAELTLTTCNPRFEATSRLVVRAKLVDRFKPGTRLPVPLAASVVTGKRPAPTKTLTTLPPVPPTTSAAPSSTPSVLPATTLPAGAGAGAARSGAVDDPTVAVASPVPGGQPTTGGARAWLGALLWGALAVVCWAVARLAAARQRRAGKAIVLAAGAVVCLLPLWFSFGNVVDLLPPNI